MARAVVCTSFSPFEGKYTLPPFLSFFFTGDQRCSYPRTILAFALLPAVAPVVADVPAPGSVRRESASRHKKRKTAQKQEDLPKTGKTS